MALTLASNQSAQGIFKIFKFEGVDDADTWTGPSNPKGYWAMITEDPSTNSSAGINVDESDGTYTFYPGVDDMNVTLFIVV